MPVEIERKFRVKGDFRKDVVRSRLIRQGYLSSHPERTVRIRISGERGWLTIKGMGDAKGLSRQEFEQEIALGDAEELFRLCEPGAIEKERHWVAAGGHIWEVDVFHGANEGLVLAEIELSSGEESFALPDWVGEEVTGDGRYYNAMLAKHPYTEFE
jgi:CYTH domain-containing protein